MSITLVNIAGQRTSSIYMHENVYIFHACRYVRGIFYVRLLGIEVFRKNRHLSLCIYILIQCIIKHI